ncbi:MAG: hypothetical protein LLG06_11045 [Desulfobacteraceae bacterium]|nr:hypothetical protein [Desulfobacteraceae bacterium]
MFQIKDWILLAAALFSIVLGVMAPRIGEPVQSVPMYSMMTLLFFSFLPIRFGAMVRSIKSISWTVLIYLFVKMVLLPLLIFLLFRLYFPKYALAALFISGVSTGVAAPFFGGLVNANISVVLTMVVFSSVLVPFTLPALAQGMAGESLEISFYAMLRLLCIVVFVPLALAEGFKYYLPKLSKRIFRVQYPVALSCFVVTNLGIFSKYSAFLRAEPATVLAALGITSFLAGLYFLSAVAVATPRPVAERLGVIVSFAIPNNVLAMVFSAEFFGPLETTVAAMYTIPFFCLLVPLRMYQRWAESRLQSPDLPDDKSGFNV